MKRYKVSQIDIANKLGISRTAVLKILNMDSNYKPAEYKRKLVLKTAKEMEYNFSQLRIRYRRDHERIKVNLPVRLIIKLKENKIYAHGTAQIRNMHIKGAGLIKIRLDKKSLPLKHFFCEIEIMKEELKGLKLIGKSYRIDLKDQDLVLVVKWSKISRENKKRMNIFLSTKK